MMPENRHDLEMGILDRLSRLIMYHLNNAAHEQYAPSADPDRMDNQIAEGKARAEAYRSVRAKVENIITGILP